MKLIPVLLMLLLAACAAENDTRAADQAAAPAPQTAAQQPVAVADPAPPAAAPKQGTIVARGEPGKVDASCVTSADCVVKDVGNCCGYFPACVNRDSPVFPEQVRAACEAEGRASICGFRDITSCECVAGQCQAASGGEASAQ